MKRIVILCCTMLLLAVTANAATEHLTNEDTIRKALACQKIVQEGGAKLIELRRLRLTNCAEAVLDCENADQQCRSKATRSKNSVEARAKCDDAHEKCAGRPALACAAEEQTCRTEATSAKNVAKALAKCGKAALKCAGKAPAICHTAMTQLENGANYFEITIAGIDTCGALDFTDLTSSAGLGFEKLADVCKSQFNLAIDDIGPLAHCVRRQYACQADKLVEAENPRVREMLRKAGVSDALVAERAQCLEDHQGDGTVLSDVARAKTLDRCDGRFRKAGEKLSGLALSNVGKCLDRVMTCVQTKPENADCIAGARAKCHKAVDQLIASGDKLERAIVGPDATCPNAFPDLQGPSGGNRQALACTCELAGVRPVSGLADAAHCLRRSHDCRITKLLSFSVPRADDLLKLVGLGLGDCMDGVTPVEHLEQRTLRLARSGRAHPSIPTLIEILTGTRTSRGKNATPYGGSKSGKKGDNAARALAIRRRVLPDSSARLVARYAKRHGVTLSLSLVGAFGNGTPGDEVFLDGYYDVDEDPVTDETDDGETHLVLDYKYPPELTTCSFELGVMVNDGDQPSAPVLISQGSISDPNVKPLELQQVEEEDVTDGSGHPVHGLEGDRWVVVSPDGHYVYAAGASNTEGFCRAPADPLKPFCKKDADCGPGGVCRKNKPLNTSDALVSFARAGDGTLSFQQTVSFGPEAGDPSLQIQVDANPLGIAVSPDTAQVYVVLGRAQALVVLTRSANGNLDLDQKIVQHLAAGESDHPLVVGDLQEPRAVLVSPDGKNVYVAAGDRHGVVVFSRNLASGVLEYLETKYNGFGDVPAQALGGATALAISPDGTTLYVAGPVDAAVAALQRNTQTGALTFGSVQRNGENGVSGLDAVRDVAISPDGKFVYAVSFNDNSLVTFARNAATGALSFVERTTNDAPSSNDPMHPLETFTPTRAVVSPDGLRVYAAGGVGDIPDDVEGPDATIAVFDRDPVTGKLQYYYDAGGNHLGGGVGVAVSPDSTSVYATTQRHASLGFYAVNVP